MNMSGKLFRKISLLLGLFVCLSGKIYSETYYRLKAGSTGGDWTDNTIWQKYNDDLLVQDYEDCATGDYPGNTASNDHVIWIPGDTNASLTLDYDAVTVQKICFNSDNDTSHNKLLTIDLNGYDLTVAEFDLGQIEASPLHGTDSKLSLINTDPDYDSVVNITNLGADPSANITLSIGSGVYVNVTNDITIGDDDTTTFTFGGDLTCNGDIVINSKVILCNDTAINAGSKNITFNGDVDSDTSSHSLTLNGAVITQNKVGFGSSSPLEDLRITVSDRYEGVNDASITAPVTCNGDLTLTGVALFRGDISAATITSSAECQFLGAVTSVETTGNQTYNGNVIINYEGVNITSTGGQITFNETFNTWSSSANPVSANFSATKTTFVKTVGETTALKNISITGNAEFGDSIIAQDITVTGNADFASDVTANDIIVTGTTSIKGTISANDVEFTGDTTLTGNTTFITTSVLFSGEVDSDGNDLTLGNNTTATTVTFSDDVIHTSTLTLYGATTVTGTATINVNEWNNPNDAVITPGSSTVTVKDSITGNNNFYNLTTTGTSLIFEAGKTQTIAGTFTAADTTLESSTAGTQWNIDVATANATVSGVTVKDSNSVNLISPTGTCVNLGNNINWAIGSAYRWIGGTSAAWNNASNWQMNTTGTTWISAVTYPGQYTSSDTALIGSANKTTNWPEFSLSSDLTISSIQIGDSTADTTSHLDFSSTGNIKLSDATPVTNYGTVKYTSTGRLTNDGATPSAVMDASHGTVYFDTGAITIDNVDTADYYNLIVNGTGHTLGGAIAVAHNFTLETSSSITSGTSLSVTGTSVFGGDITTTGTQTYTGAATLNTDITFKAGTNTVTFGSTINCAAGSNFDLTIGSTAVHTKAEVKGNIGATNAIANLTTFGFFKMNSGSITCTGDILVNAGGAEFRGNVTANSISITGTTTVGTATQSITTTGTISPSSPYSQVYNGAFQFHYANLQLTAETYSIAFNGTVDTYSSATSARSLSIGTAAKKTNAVFTHSVGATNTYPLDTLSVAGTTAFDATVTDVKTSGAQTYGDNVSYSSDITFSAGTDTTPAAITIEATSDFTDSSASPHNVTIAAGDFSFGTGNFITGKLTVAAGASFIQTGDNGSNTHSVGGLVNNGVLIWDENRDGGTLAIGSDGVAKNDDYLVVFNLKNLGFTAPGTYDFNGIVYDLIIPDGVTIRNTGRIVALRNIIVEGSGTYTNIDSSGSDHALYWGSAPTQASGQTYNSVTGSITTRAGGSSATQTSVNLGRITINQKDTTKTVETQLNVTTLNCQDTTTGGSIIFEKNLTGTNGLSLTTKGSLTFGADGASVVTSFANNVTITQASSVTIGGTLKTTGANHSISITPDTTLSANTTIQTTGGAVTLNKITGAASTLDITSGTGTTGAITLNKAVTVKELTITNPASLTIKQPASITAADGFTLTGAGTVALGTAAATANLSITTANTDIKFTGTGAVTLLSPVVLTTGTGNGNIILNQNFNGTTAGTEKITLNSGTGNITINANLGSTTSLGDTTITGNAITLEDSRALRASKVTVTNSGLLLLKPSSAVTAATGFTKTGSGLSQIASSITTTNSAISFNNQTYIYGASSFNAGTANVTIGTGSGTNEDLYISALSGTTAQAVSITAGTLDVKGNVALFNGNVTLASNLSSGKDIVLLNGNASTMYNETTVSGLYDYHNSLRTSANKLCPPTLNITTTPSHYPESMPDGTTTIAHTSYSSSLTGFEGKTIKAGQNFYDNGVNLSATASWTLKLKDNDSSLDSFAELYHASISYCQVECNTTGGYAWLSAGETVTDGGNNSADDTALINYSLDGSYTRVKTGVAFIHPIILTDDTTQSASEGRKTGPEVPNLSGTYSVRDNVIRVEFVRSNYTSGTIQNLATALIENSNNEISSAIANIKYNGGTNSFEGVYIDAECTVSTNNMGDIAVFYLKAPDNARWNLDTTGISYGVDSDTEGNINSRYTDIQIQRALSTVFATLTDDHKNRIGSYYGTPSTSPSSAEGFRFTATTSRCAFGNMHITFAIADFTSNKIYLYFDNPLSDTITWETYNPGTPIKTEDAIKIYSTPTTQDTTFSVVSVDRNALNDHGLVIELNQNLDYTKINYGIKIEYGGSFLFNNKIHSPDRKVVISGESHCISDFLVNAIDVQYAYDNRNDEYIQAMNGNAAEDSIAIRDFSGTTKRNKLFADKNLTVVTKNVSGESNFNFKMVADISPSAHSEGETFTKYSGLTTRAWFPSYSADIVETFSPALNTSGNIQISSDAGSGANIESSTNTTTGITTYLLHNFSEETPFLNWTTGSNVRFLFEVLNGTSSYTINHSYSATTPVNTPLYAVRLKSPGAFTSIDLWSFGIAEPQRQRGGATIYNNVINASLKEFCTLEVNLAKEDSLRVIVMTADGNIVQYLENGRQSAGLHYYYWNGTNNSGDAVARGIYFIRIVSSDIDETRKVLVVK